MILLLNIEIAKYIFKCNIFLQCYVLNFVKQIVKEGVIVDFCIKVNGELF